MIKHNESIRLFYYLFLLIFNITIVITMDFDLESTIILGSKDQYRIELQPRRVNGPISINYTRIPEEWLTTEKYILVNKTTTRIYKQDLISVVLSDITKEEYKISIIFLYNSEHMFMDSTSYPYNVNSSELWLDSIDFENPKLDKNILDQQIQDILNQVSKFNGPVLDFKTVFNNVLLPNEVLDAANNNNVPVLIKSIALISTSDINCIQQVAYLSQISSILYQTLQNKQKLERKNQENYLNKIKSKYIPINSINVTANLTILPVEKQPLPFNDTSTILLQNKTRERINKLEGNVKELKTQYVNTIENLKQAYSEFYTISLLLDKTQKTLIEYNIKIDKLLNNIKKYRLLIEDINWRIPSSKPEDKIIYKQKINVYNTVISTQNEEVNKLRENVQEQESIIKNILDELDKRKLLTKTLESKINSLQIQISEINKQLLFLYQPIFEYDTSSLFIILQQNGYNLNLRTNSEIDILTESWLSISSLTDIILYLNKFVDIIYYQCYGVKNIEFTDNIGLYAYQIEYKDFMKYLFNLYQAESNSSKYIMDNSSRNNHKIYLEKISVLSSIWTNRFGEAIDSSIGASLSTGSKKPNFTECRSYANMRGYNGVITQISNNIIQVRVSVSSQGNMAYVLLGACSRIELTGGLPEPGSLIFWKGIEIGNQIYDSYYVLII